jgi:hypothetical protein
MEENINNPSYYGGKTNPYEAIKIIEALNLGFNLGNTLKYLARAGKKDASKELEDLKKAAFYLDRQIKTLEAAKLPDGIKDGKYQVNYIAHANYLKY